MIWSEVIYRIRQMIAYNVPMNQIHDKLLAAGIVEHDIYLLYQAALYMENTKNG